MARLVTKVVEWKWPRIRRLARVEPGQRTKAKGKEAALKAKQSKPAKPQAVAQEKKAANPPVLPPVGKEDPPPAKA